MIWFSKLVLPIVVSATIHSPSLQTTPAPTTPRANAEDVSSIDSIVNALYASASGPKGEKHQWDRLRSLFQPDARMGDVWRSDTGALRYESVTVDKYASQADKDMTDTGYFEKELHRHVDQFGDLAQVFSSYESRNDPTAKAPAFRGINSMQLVYAGNRWWIASIQWRSEDSHLKLPRSRTTAGKDRNPASAGG